MRRPTSGTRGQWKAQPRGATRCETYNTREYSGGPESLSERIFVTDTILNDDYRRSLLVEARFDLRGHARLIYGFVRADDVVELTPCFCHAFHHLRVCQRPAYEFLFAWLPTIVGVDVVLAVVPARYFDSIRLDGVIV